MKRKKKENLLAKLARGDVTNRLYAAVARYIEAKGGKLVVIGGIQVQRWPGDAKHNFVLGIKCTGRGPTFEKDNP